MQVFAADLFVSKFKDDLLNQYAGLRFRNKVIANALLACSCELLHNAYITAGVGSRRLKRSFGDNNRLPRKRTITTTFYSEQNKE
jgi:hypothetical protein